VQGDLFRLSRTRLIIKGGSRRRWRVASRPLTRPTVALQHRTSVVFVSCVLRSHMSKRFPRSAALPHEVRGRSPSFVPFLSCVNCPYRPLLSSVSLSAAFAGLQPRAAVWRGCSVAHRHAVAQHRLRCAPPANPRAFSQSASQQLRSSWGSPSAGWRIRRVSRGMQPRVRVQPAPPQLAARPLHSQAPPRRPSHPLPQGLFATLIPPKLIATRTKNPARTPLSPST
jgi:hypothetical protein